MAGKRLTQKEKKPILFRVPPELHAELVELAGKRRWTLQTLMEFISEKYVEQTKLQAVQGQQSVGK